MHRINHRRKSRSNLPLIVGGALALVLAGVAATAVGLFVEQYASASDDAGTLLELIEDEYLPGNVFYDRNGRLLHQDVTSGASGEDILRQAVTLDRISPFLQEAVVSTEDASFYDNPGVNIRGLSRAVYENFFPANDDGVLEGSGGSSITQQLAKLLYFTYEERIDRSFSRKNREIFLALAINEKYSKDEILEAYLNVVPLGNLTQGAEAASRVYFGKHADELTLGEAALLAAIPNNPTRFDPYRNWTLAKARQEDVIDLMEKREVITAGEAEAARAEPLDERHRFTTDTPDVASLKDSPAPHFVRYAQDELRELVGDEVYKHGGLKVTTSLDTDIHLRAQEITQEWSYRFETTLDPPPHNAALSGIDPNSGEILFYVGSRNYNDRPIEGENDILRSLQQPGSTMKIFTYLAAFWKGAPDNPETRGYDETLLHYKPETPVLDSQINPPLPGCINPIDPAYSPQNADRSFRGQMTIRDALRFSRNVPAVRTISEVGWRSVIDTAHLMGIIGLNNENGYGCAITVGGADLRPLDLTFAAATFANNGLMKGRPAVADALRRTGVAMVGDQEIGVTETARNIDPVSILRVVDAGGNVIYDYATPAEEQVVPAHYAYLVSDVLRMPTGTLGFSICDQDVAAKTGTQEKEDLTPEDPKRYSLDTWTVGWSRHLAVAVWVGNSDNQPISRDSFSTNTAGKLFQSIMETFLCDKPRLPFEQPAVPEDYAATANRSAPPPDTLDPDECRRLLEDSGYQPIDLEEDPTLEELISEICSGRGGVGSGDCTPEPLDPALEEGTPVELPEFVPCPPGGADGSGGDGDDGDGGAGDNPFIPGPDDNPFTPGID